MIMIVDVCSERLGYLEFVKPIEDILKKARIGFFTTHYANIKQGHFAQAEKIIACGTALEDFKYLRDIDKFEWMRKSHKPILGICAGMQILGLIFGSRLIEKTRIGRYRVNIIRKNSLTSKDEFYSYFLNSKTVELGGDFETLAESAGLHCMMKHKYRRLYGCLFHPEVLNPEIVSNFIQETKN
jgi:GMP synthase (glutamine-hydrolysing)